MSDTTNVGNRTGIEMHYNLQSECSRHILPFLMPAYFWVGSEGEWKAKREPCKTPGRNGFKIVEKVVHPICAYGIMEDLRDLYRDQSLRVPGCKNIVRMLITGAKAIRAATKVAGRKGPAAGEESEGTNPRGLSRLIGTSVLKESVFRCENAEETAKVMWPVKRGAICWTQVKDYNSLLCRYWKADMAVERILGRVEKPCSVADRACCQAIAAKHGGYRSLVRDDKIAGRRKWIEERKADLERASKALVGWASGPERDEYVGLLTSELDGWNQLSEFQKALEEKKSGVPPEEEEQRENRV